ncbi:DUF5519 family protein [Actinomadura fulvescens]|uniref:DUF5519 family protein n=1 Tax=Actinomadura fulvescens TaxID=46160 RepID=A0ABP6CPX7_9ACTN
MGFPSAEAGFADCAYRQLRTWPVLTACQTAAGSGKALALRTRQIVHLHGQDEAEVYLTRPVLQRMAEVLNETGRVTMAPDQEWVRVRLDHPTDVTLLVSLVSVAIKANTPAMDVPHRDVSPCPRAMTAAL